MSGIAQALFMGGKRDILYVGSATGTQTTLSTAWTISLTSLSGGAGSAAQSGDLVVVFYAASTGNDFALSATGYTQITKTYVNGSNDTILYTGYKFMPSTPDTTIELSALLGVAGTSGAAAIQVWRNVNTTTPLDVTSTIASNTASILANPPSITPITSGAVILAGGGGAYTSASTRTYSSSDLSAFITASANATTDCIVGAGYKTWTSGAFDPAAFTFSAADSSTYTSIGVTIALRPA